MKLDDLQAGENVFLDSNTLVYHFIPFPVLGPLCTKLINRIERKEVFGFTSTHVLSEVAHRLMTTEASQLFGWKTKVVNRLKQQPAAIQKLTTFRQAIERIPQIGIQILIIPEQMIATAAALSVQYGLLSNDALLVALMQANGLSNLASSDADFDRVPGLVRYSAA